MPGRLSICLAVVASIVFSMIAGVWITFVGIKVYERVLDDIQCIVNEVCDDH